MTLINGKEYDLKAGADLRGANFQGADLQGADLKGTDLQGAHLQGANLQGADLQVADLRGADLQGANLQGADLWRANLQVANLQGADLRRANLRVADLRRANLWGANLQGADLQVADLQGAHLQGANLPLFQIPQDGSLTCWKALKNKTIAQMEIPADAKRTASLAGRKCRAEYVRVLKIIGGNRTSGSGLYDGTEYKVGEIVRPDKYDDDIRVECSHGIHFFLTREEAENYSDN